MKLLLLPFFILLALLVFVPFEPVMPSVGLDPSWKAVIVNAFVNGEQWGRDIIFTYGPLGFIHTKYYFDDYYRLAIPLWIYIVAVSAVLAWFSFRGRNNYLLAIVLVCIVVYAPLMLDTVFLLFISLPLFYFHSKNGYRTELLVLGLGVLAILSLVKMTFLFFSVGVVVLIQVSQLYRGRTFPLTLLCFALMYLSAYLLAGQELSNFKYFLVSSLQIVAGYGDAMSVPGPIFEVQVFFGMVLVIAFLARKLFAQTDQAFDKRLAILCLTAAILFVSYKSGFIRHDLHSLLSWGGVLAACVALLYLLPVVAERKHSVTIALLCAGALSMGVERFSSSTDTGVVDYLENGVAKAYAKNFYALQSLLFDFSNYRGEIRTRYAVAIESLAEDSPIRELTGTIDTIESNQGQILAAGLSYKHRPVIQEYTTYTPYLQRSNESFFETTPPDYLLIKPGSVDGRLPMLAEGFSWPTFFRTYDIEGLLSGRILLKKSELEGKILVTPIMEREIIPDEEISLEGEGWMFAKLKFNKSVVGHLSSFLYKVPPVFINYSTESEFSSYRIVPAMTEMGVYISPVVRTGNEMFVQMLAPCSSDRCPKFFSIDVGGRLGKAMYSSIELQLYRHEFDAVTMVSPRLLNTAKSLSNLGSLGSTSELGWPQVALVGGKLLAQAPSEMSFSVAGNGLLSVRYGIRRLGESHSDGVCFYLEDEEGSVIVKECLQEASDTDTLVEGRFLIDVAGYSGKVSFRNECRESSCNLAGAYWKELLTR